MTRDSRMARLQQRLADEGVDLLALAPGAHMDWLLGFHPHPDERPCLLCITPTGAAFLMPALNAQAVRARSALAFHEWDDATGPQAAFGALLQGLGAADARRIALDETMRADFAALVQDALPGAARQFSASTIGALRMRKDAGDYAVLKRNAATADAAMRAARAAIRPGMTETDVARIVQDSFRASGATPMFAIIGAGPNGAFPHHQTGETVLRQGDAVVIDIGGTTGGFFSDMTRMVVLGTPPQGYAEVHAVVEAAVQAALAAARPGVPAHVVDDAARGVITAAGYGPYFVHRTGHGLGVEIHEPPYITATAQTVLEEGMVFSIEPGIYLPGRFGIRLEDIVILRADGPEVLSDLPRDLVTV